MSLGDGASAAWWHHCRLLELEAMRTRHAAEIIVETAIALRKRYPDVPALSILDAVMCRAEPHIRAAVTGPRSKPWLRPPGEFADLIREAFAPDVTYAAADCAGAAQELLHAWDDVLKQFAARYE